MNDELKLDLKSMSITEDKKAQLKQLFPEVFTESRIDFNRLKQILGESVETGKERYGMTWAGKSNCFKIIQEPSIGTLRLCREESINFDEAENVFIEGDNLEVLKLLQKSYYGKVKMIYIDPPYNTGNEFIYPDNFSENLDTYLKYTGQKDAEGRMFSTNLETDGRFHSKWMNMIYTRLYLARNLLKDDGVIFISIDDNEYCNLKNICDEIFGEENFKSNIAWQKKYAVSNNFKGIASIKDHILVYAKSDKFINGFLPRSDESAARYCNPDNDPRGVWKPVDYWNQASPEDRPNLVYTITNPNTGLKINPSKKAWKYSYEVHCEHIRDDRIYWGSEGKNTVPSLKLFLTDVRDGLIPHNWWPHDDSGHTDEAKKELEKLFHTATFDTPKPIRLIKKMCQVANLSEDSIVLDFFSGSSSTAQAVLEINHEIGAKLKFICVQLPESCSNEGIGFKTIADIGKERIRRVIKKITDDITDANNYLGFKVLKLSLSSFKPWETGHDQDISENLKLFADHIDPNANPEDILYEILLKSGFELTTKIEKIKIGGIDTFSIENGTMFIFLGDTVTKEFTHEVAENAPSRFVCLDHSFHNNDQLKTNTVQLLKSRNIEFRTV